MKIEAIRHQAGSVVARSTLIYDGATAERRPLLLVSSNWLGMTYESTQRAAKLAGSKYIVLLADMYGEGKAAATSAEIVDRANALRADVAERRRRMAAALEALISASQERGIGDLSCKAAVGFCFGGGNVLELARDGADLSAAICVHGDLSTNQPANAGDIKASVFVLHGAADPVVTKAARDAFEGEMTAAGAKWQMMTFGKALHSFSEEETNVPGISQFEPGIATQTYKMIDDYLAGALAGLL
ncbi:dienelactone hydrolase family protein [Paraburkholderia sediminicola]|uniref:dienelactone hydrolase family protein n=1 Tax=Paraburkholderia sediminicola TaxID=458836 RepID=UPI0038BAAF40